MNRSRKETVFTTCLAYESGFIAEAMHFLKYFPHHHLCSTHQGTGQLSAVYIQITRKEQVDCFTSSAYGVEHRRYDGSSGSIDHGARKFLANALLQSMTMVFVLCLCRIKTQVFRYQNPYTRLVTVCFQCRQLL